ncbi:uncharacterized protein SETTUDRAFT_36555 [Exserohilum turcica Et28A]|uniref:Heterokaryon incompatibility domain-containing protein n=1 Tax=Exserohilum turcicum (strain 28A) TaxID=671987 RepID=R0KPX5_EXST2|nr:uncharacterized protein SETTUDRAFT_36555 [Exserohilum turcica Et28A]EOA91069.1 hypothetical protein SETTUDRAFT_36555 [Exserohilum turcica Et28A]
MVPPLVSYTKITDWMNQTYDHSEPRADPVLRSRTAVPLTVIECTTRSLIILPENEAYVTVSYVWGSVTFDQTTTQSGKYEPNSLPLQLPSTIEDSITACLALNFRYLWVDRYCIHGSHDVCAQQIKHMDKIYSESALTIIACAGADSSYGLPGVSRPRKPDPSIEIKGLGYLRAIPAMYDIESSVWATRGWTYQEALLSKRQLYFTEKQLFLGLYDKIESEAVVHGGDWVSGAISDVARSKHSLGMSNVYDCIGEYSERQLSYPEDILNALLGILSKFHETRGVFHVWGVPFKGSNSNPPEGSTQSNELVFEESLCWSANKQTPRKGFPTWSWTSRDGVVRWPIMFPLTLVSAPSNAGAAPKFEVELRSGQLCSLSEYQVRYDHLNNYSEAVLSQDRPSQFIHVEAFVSPIVKIQDMVISDRVVLRSSTGEPIFLEVVGSERLAPGLPGSLVAVHLVTGSYAHVRTKYALIVRDMGDHWERAVLIEDIECLLEGAVKVRRKLRLG